MQANSSSDQPDRVLVIGGGGFIGRHVIKAFLDDGADVVVLDVVRPQKTPENVEWTVGSVSDLSLVGAVAAGCSTVLFLANSSLPGSSSADLAVEVEAHVLMTIKVAETCASVGVKRFLFASSGGTVYGFEPDSGAPLHENMRLFPRNAYGVSKMAIENYLRLLGSLRDMNTLSLRLSNPYGPGQRASRGQGFVAAAMQHAMNDTPISIWGDGTVERDFIYVTEAADAFVKASKYEGTAQAINIGSGQGTSLNEILEHIQRLHDKEVTINYEPSRPIDVRKNVLDVRRAAQELDWHPSITLENGLTKTAKWWKKHHK